MNLQNVKVRKLFSGYRVQFAYLFGSRATGKKTIKQSDYDIAILFGAGTAALRFATRLQLLHELQELFAPIRVDLIVLDDINSATLRYEVVRTGRLLYSRDESRRMDFELRAMDEYQDFSPFLKAYGNAYIGNV